MQRAKLWLARGVLGLFAAMLLYMFAWAFALYMGWLTSLLIFAGAAVIVGALMWALTTISEEASN